MFVVIVNTLLIAKKIFNFTVLLIKKLKLINVIFVVIVLRVELILLDTSGQFTLNRVMSQDIW